MKTLTSCALLIALIGSVALSCGGPSEGAVRWYDTDTGLRYADTAPGFGRQAQSGDIVQVHYTGWLIVNGARGQLFDSSVGSEPLQFKLGAGQVIRGWEEGVRGMQEGGTRRLIIPPDLAYGDRGFSSVIPPGSTLEFEVELLKIVSR